MSEMVCLCFFLLLVDFLLTHIAPSPDSPLNCGLMGPFDLMLNCNHALSLSAMASPPGHS